MIKINFALRKTASGAGDPGASESAAGGFSLKNLFKSKGSVPSVQVEDLRELPLTAMLSWIAVWVLSSMVVENVTSEEMAKAQDETKKLETQIDQLQKAVAKKKDREVQKKEMEEVEKLYRVKIQTIEMLAADRQGAAKTMESLSRVVPPEVWLLGFQFSDQQATFQGAAKSLSFFTEFVKNLNSSAEFTDAVPVQAQTQADPVFGSSAAIFVVNAKRQKR
jgi:Tfp pilus assembly protein PilN